MDITSCQYRNQTDYIMLSEFSLERIHQDPKFLLNFLAIKDVAGGVGCAEVGALQTLPAC